MSNFKAFESRDFRRYFFGQSISYIGNKMQLAALAWHAYELTNDPLALGLIGFWRFLPIALLTLWGGAFVDRAKDQRAVMLWGQVVMGAISLTLGILTVFDITKIWHLYLTAGLTAAVTAVDIPAKQAVLPALVPRYALPSAIRLNALASTVAEVIGPAIFGVLLWVSSLSSVYLINALSFLGVIFALLTLEARPKGEKKQGERPLQTIISGLHFVRKTPALWGILLMDFLASFFASGVTLLPIVAKEFLGGGAGIYASLNSAMAIGAVSVTIALSTLPPPRAAGKAMIGAITVYGLATVSLGLVSQQWLALICVACIGGGEIASRVLRDTARQLITPDPLRGRVGALNTLTSKSGPRLGELEAGIIASGWGVRASLISGGILCIFVASLFFIFHKQLRDYEDRYDEG